MLCKLKYVGIILWAVLNYNLNLQLLVKRFTDLNFLSLSYIILLGKLYN